MDVSISGVWTMEESVVKDKLLAGEVDTVERLFRDNVDSILSLCQRFPWNGQLMSTCEAELQELMKQIDIMVQNKKVEWERELQAAESKLQLKERECTMQKATVDQKAREIATLRQQVEGLERNHRLANTEYDRTLDKVKADFESLRRDYEKLQKKMSRHSKEAQKEKTKTCTELQGTQAEVQRAQSRLEDYRQRSKDWDLEKRNLEKQIESLESQRRTLQDKCDLIEQQASGYQSQLDKRRQILDNTEYNLNTQISQLEGQLERAHDTINAQESQIAKLKSTLDETVAIQRRILEEKDFTERELRDAKKHAVSVEDEMCSLRVEYQKQEEYLRLATAAQQTTQQHDLDAHAQQLQSKANELLEEKSAQIKKLTEELKQSKTDCKQLKKSEKRLTDELSRQRSQIKQAEQDVDKLRVKFQERMGNMKGTETKKCKELQAEVSKLKQSLSAQAESSEDQLSELRRQVSSLRAELHERQLVVAQLTERAEQAQAQQRHEQEQFQQRAAEIQVCNAQLEALRLENRHLRQTAMKQIQTNSDVMEAEAHLKELQNAYTSSLARIEAENKNLHQQLAMVQDRMRDLQGECAEKERQARTAAQRSIQELQTMEERRIAEMQSDYENRIAGMQARMERKLREAQTELDQSLHEKTALEREIKQRTTVMKRAASENEVMSHFVEGVSEIISQAPQEDVRARMVTPRLVGAFDDPAHFPDPAHFDAPYTEPRNTAKTSTKVHFNESELPLLMHGHSTADSFRSPDRSLTADKATQSGARPKRQQDFPQAFHSDDRKMASSIERISPPKGPMTGSPKDARLGSPLVGRDIGTPMKAPSPMGRIPSPMGTSPLRIPSPSHAFQRISPQQREERGDRPLARSASLDPRPPPDTPRRPGSAPAQADVTAPHADVTIPGDVIDVSGLVNFSSLSDTSDAERPPSRASLATRFYEEEQERAKELEKLIDSHIEDLKTETEKTIRKYTR